MEDEAKEREISTQYIPENNWNGQQIEGKRSQKAATVHVESKLLTSIYIDVKSYCATQRQVGLSERKEKKKKLTSRETTNRGTDDGLDYNMFVGCTVFEPRIITPWPYVRWFFSSFFYIIFFSLSLFRSFCARLYGHWFRMCILFRPLFFKHIWKRRRRKKEHQHVRRTQSSKSKQQPWFV